MSGSLNLGVGNLQSNLLADIPGLENLSSNPQLSGLLNLGDLTGKTPALPTDQNLLLANLAQNPEKLAQQLADSKQDLSQQNLQNLLGMPGDKLGGLDAGKGQQTSANHNQQQNLQINSGTTATSPGEKEQVASGSQQFDKAFDVNNILQDSHALAMSLNDNSASNKQIQDVLKALNGGNVTGSNDLQKAASNQAVGGADGANALKGATDLNSVTQLGDLEHLQGLLGGAGGNSMDKIGQLSNFEITN